MAAGFSPANQSEDDEVKSVCWTQGSLSYVAHPLDFEPEHNSIIETI